MKLLSVLACLLLITSCSAQSLSRISGMKNARTVTVHVNGDCGMCKKTIEKVAFVKGEAEADWDVDAKTARITYDSVHTTLDAVLERIAQAGYDSEKFLAPDAAYAALPGCCQYERTDKRAAMDHSAVDGEVAVSEAPVDQTTTNPKSDQFNDLFTSYFTLKNALVASDAKAAAESAAGFSAAVKAVQMERMNPEMHGVWMQVMEPLTNLGAGIAAKSDLDAQRKAFAEMAAPMLSLVKVAPRAEPIYLDHCPMYEGGADWLSLEKPIKNPFYGSMMLTCGSVKQTIP